MKLLFLYTHILFLCISHTLLQAAAAAQPPTKKQLKQAEAAQLQMIEDQKRHRALSDEVLQRLQCGSLSCFDSRFLGDNLCQLRAAFVALHFRNTEQRLTDGSTDIKPITQKTDPEDHKEHATKFTPLDFLAECYVMTAPNFAKLIQLGYSKSAIDVMQRTLRSRINQKTLQFATELCNQSNIQPITPLELKIGQRTMQTLPCFPTIKAILAACKASHVHIALEPRVFCTNCKGFQRFPAQLYEVKNNTYQLTKDILPPLTPVLTFQGRQHEGSIFEILQALGEDTTLPSIPLPARKKCSCKVSPSYTCLDAALEDIVLTNAANTPQFGSALTPPNFWDQHAALHQEIEFFKYKTAGCTPSNMQQFLIHHTATYTAQELQQRAKQL